MRYFSLATIKRVFSFQIEWLRPKGPRFEGHDIVANSVIYVLTYKLTNIFSKEACFGHTQSLPQPELVGFAAIIFLWYDKPEAYFAKEGTDAGKCSTHSRGLGALSRAWRSTLSSSLAAG